MFKASTHRTDQSVRVDPYGSAVDRHVLAIRRIRVSCEQISADRTFRTDQLVVDEHVRAIRVRISYTNKHVRII